MCTPSLSLFLWACYSCIGIHLSVSDLSFDKDLTHYADKNATIVFHKIMRRFSLPCMLNIKLACGLSVFNRPLLSLAMCFYLCLCVQTWWGR